MKSMLISVFALLIQASSLFAQADSGEWAMATVLGHLVTEQSESRSASALRPDLSAGQQDARFPGLAEWLAAAIDYPESGRVRGLEGTVTLELKISEQGEVLDVRVIRPLEAAFDQAALDALYAMPTWEPARNYGIPVRSKTRVDVAFTLR